MPKKQCSCCGKFLKPKSHLSVVQDERALNVLKTAFNSSLTIQSKVCDSCRCFSIKKRRITDAKEMSSSENDLSNVLEPGKSQIYKNSESSSEDGTSDSDCRKIKLPIRRCMISQSRCIVCHHKNNRIRIKPFAALRVYVDTGILIPAKARCCASHLVDNGFLKKEAVASIQATSDFTHMNAESISKLLNDLREEARKTGLNFDDPSALEDKDYYRLTGLTKNQFSDVAQYLSIEVRSTKGRSVRLCLALLLIKLRTGLSNAILSTIFGIEKRRVGRGITAARKALMSSFVPHHLGIGHISPESVIKDHTTSTAKTLFANGEDVCILVADGTYMFIQKSSNYSFQRRTYSMHKGRNLVKPMMLVTTTGYIVDVFGPYFADGKNNDASIFESLLKQDSIKLRTWMPSNSVIVVDRGFRDCLKFLEDLGFVSKMPHFLQKGSQHTTIEANESRLVTKVRWVVEAVNGLIKTWRALSDVFPNSQIPYIGDYVRIVCALCNAFRPPRIHDNSDDHLIAERMLRLASQPNRLQERAEKENWAKRRASWLPITQETLPDFPRLTLDELRYITLGVYQLKQAQSYTEEHLSDDGMYSLLVHKQEEGILRVQIQSRHTSSKVYNLWIETNPGPNPISGWYCQCKSGARVVGCCAHIASVLWYLGYSRYNQNTPRPSREFESHVNDASCWSENEGEAASSSDDQTNSDE